MLDDNFQAMKEGGISDGHRSSSPTQVHPMTLEVQQPRPSKRSYASFLEERQPSRARLDARVSRWLDSFDSGVSSRSDSGLDSLAHTLPDLPLPPQKRPRSAPEMGQPDNGPGACAGAATGAMYPPPTPSVTSAGIRSQSQSRRSSSGTSTLGPRDTGYRRLVLDKNSIFIESEPNELPQHIGEHVAEIRSRLRDSPEPTPEAMAAYLKDRKRLDPGCDEGDVTDLLKTWVLPPKAYCDDSGLECSNGLLMSAHLVPPCPPAAPTRKISQPKPDLLYGYNGWSQASPFTPSQFMAQQSLDTYPGQSFVDANSRGLQFPFFALELKADAGTSGSIYVAENQCAGDVAACLNAAERLNDLLADISQPMVDNLTYCLAMDNRHAHLFVSWKPERLSYYMYEVDAYRLSKEQDFREFRRHVRNILDWGRDQRLKQIAEALDVILEADRLGTAKAARARTPPAAAGPSDDPSSKRRRSGGSSKGGRA